MAMNTRSVQRALNSMMGGRHAQNGDYINREPVMRIGSEYQAEIPGLASQGNSSVKGVGSVLVWAPCPRTHERDVNEYIKVAKEQYGYTLDQALGLLYWHKYDIKRATEDLANFCPLQDEWSMEDRVTFEQAFQYHGKNFQRIRAMLPDKPISSLVKHYYLRKKSYSQYSLMDKHAKKNWKRISTGMPISNDDTDSNKSGSSRSETFAAPLPIMLPPLPLGPGAKGKQLPKGIYLSTHELSSLTNDTSHTFLQQLDREIKLYRETIQSNIQTIVSVKDGGHDNIENFRPQEFSKKSGLSMQGCKWSDEEIRICLEVISSHGKNYDALVSALEGKTLQQVKNFFTNYKRKLNLPKLIAEYEISHGQKASRYSRQAHELLENGGLDDDDLMSEIILGPTESKRPRMMSGHIANSITMPTIAMEVTHNGQGQF
ncbi:REST corepressor 3-like [Halichondria panicea]|uniref:REST corepressor 3-like n=1 Tax=Halichondria panicea TaxID=6063 RepID=UPI00312B7A66